MKMRRRIAFPEAQDYADCGSQWHDYSRDLRPAEWGSGIILRNSNSVDQPVAFGSIATHSQGSTESALPLLATGSLRNADRRDGPEAVFMGTRFCVDRGTTFRRAHWCGMFLWGIRCG
jgi:hypothetical protein